MAEEDENQETKGKTSEKKKLIVLAIISFLVVGIAVGVTILLLSDSSEDNVDNIDAIENVEELEDQGSDDEPEDEVVEEDVVEEEVVEDEKKRALYYEFKPAVLATFNQGKKVRYMQVTLSAMARDQAALDALDYHMPLIRSKINSLYSSQDFQFVQTEDGKLALQAETINVINALLLAEGEPSIEDVYFTNFVLQ